MDRYEYRSKRAERRATGAGIALTGAGALNEWAAGQGVDVLATATQGAAHGMASMQLNAAADVLAALPGGSGLIGLGLIAIAAGQGHRAYRKTDYAELRRCLHARKGWMTTSDLLRYSGVQAARRDGKATRHTLSAADRARRPASDFGFVLGRTVTGPPAVRGRRVMTSWQHGVLIAGEPGSRKSGMIANAVLDHPGPAVVVSTKSEFWTACAEPRALQHGPIRLFAPRSRLTSQHAEHVLTWDLVEGCRDVATAERRAEALMAAASGDGLQNSSFWESKGRALFKALLVAADLDGVSLREVAKWLQSEDYSRPLKVLTHHQNELEPSLISGLQQYAKSGAQATSSSAAHTAAQVVEFLSDPDVAAALAPPRGTGMDIQAFLQANGTLFVVSDGSAGMGPVINALVTHIAWELKQLVVGDAVSHDPPLAFIIDEAHKTMPSVALHEMAAELRGWGVWMAVVIQNHAQLDEKWGKEAARTLRTCLPTTVVTGATDPEDRQHYSDRIGPRKITQVSESINQGHSGGDVRRGSGSGTSTQFQTAEVPVWPPYRFADLRPEQAVVIPTSGRPCIVAFEHGLGRAEALKEKLRARKSVQAQRAEALRRITGGGAAEPVGGEQA